MVKRENLDELIGEIFRDCRVAVCHMGDEIDQVTKRNDPTVCR
jgi:hypothetical protein